MDREGVYFLSNTLQLAVKKLTGVTLIGFFHAIIRVGTKVYSILKGSSIRKFWYLGLFMHWTAFIFPKNTSFNHCIDTDGTFHSLAFLYLSPSQLEIKKDKGLILINFQGNFQSEQSLADLLVRPNRRRRTTVDSEKNIPALIITQALQKWNYF